jgi:hypothetical protein
MIVISLKPRLRKHYDFKKHQPLEDSKMITMTDLSDYYDTTDDEIYSMLISNNDPPMELSTLVLPAANQPSYVRNDFNDNQES